MGLTATDIFEGVGRLAIVGVAKNCGKTTTLNHLVGSSATADRTVGLVSVGIDGEAADVLIGTRKPPIAVEPGHWIVTARDALERSTARIEYVDSLGFSTPLGEVFVGRVLEAGTIVLAGMRHRNDLEAALERLEARGADLVVIDGAYGRTVAARSDLSEAVVVSTGAVLADGIEEIVEATARLVDRLALPAIEAPWQRALLDEALARGRALLGGAGVDPIALPARSALLGLSEADDLWTDAIHGVAIPGLVSDRVVEELLAAGGAGRALLVPDGTVLQADRRLLDRLERHWEVLAGRPTDVRAVSVNPTGIQGHSVDADELLAALRRRWPTRAIFNPLHATASSA
jgi:hypothetical protein